MLKILVISANPVEATYLSVDQEYRRIYEALSKSDYYESEIMPEYWPAASPNDLTNKIEAFRPNVLHFSGHATKVGNLVFQSSEDTPLEVEKDPISMVLKILGKDLQCIILNACYSKDQAKAIIEKMPCVVIGMPSKVKDPVAIEFSSRFYEWIGKGKTIDEVIKLTDYDLRNNANKQVKRYYKGINVENHPSVNLEKIRLLETSEDELEEYLNDLIKDANMGKKNGDNSSNILKVKYIERRDAAYVDVTNEWYISDDKILIKYSKETTDIRKLIDNFVESQHHRLLFVAGTFGIGKSVLVRKISSEYAARFLDSRNEFLKNRNQHIPIFVPLKNGLNNIHKGKSLRSLLQNIVAHPRPNRNILLILDSLDEYEYRGSLKELYATLIDYCDTYKNMKVILTSRLHASIPSIFEIEGQKYIRLLPFTGEQVDEFFRNNNLDLTYEDATKHYGIRHDEITKPLLVSMLLKVFPIIKAALEYMQYDKSITSNMYKAIIYFHFLSNVKEEEQIETDGENKIKQYAKYRDEKIVIRKIALLKQIYKDKLTSDIVEKLAEPFNFKSNMPNPISSILCHTSLCQRSNDEKETIIGFDHETFREYLLAENYLEILVNGKNNASPMNAVIPTDETINFLDGLIQIIKSDNENVKKFIEPNDDGRISLFNLFKLPDNIYDKDDIIEEIIDNAINNVNDEGIVLYDPYYERKEDKKVSWIRPEENIPVNEYAHLWIHRWISLYILQKLNVINRPDVCRKLGLATKENDNKKRISSLERISRLLRLTSFVDLLFNMPELKKLNNLDLSGINLSGADLSGADLSGINLSGADLSGANLHGAVLNHANLSKCNLTNVNFFNADLTHADLSNSILLRADLSGAKLENASLKDANISDANISDAKLSNSNLVGADLYRANLDNAQLNEAHLDKAKISYANLSYANLSDAILKDANLSYANLSDADLYNADLSDTKLDKANISHANLYKTTFDKENLSNVYGKDLANFSDEIITTIPNNKEQIPNNSSIIVVFAKPITKNDNNNDIISTFTLKKLESSDDVEYERVISENSKIVTFKPKNELTPSTKYIASIMDSAWEFTTSDLPGKNLNFSIIMGSGHDGNKYDNVIDSDLNTRWSNYGKSYITADLRAIKSIYAIDIGWFKGNRREYVFEIVVASNDYKDFSNVVYKGRSSGKTLCPERYKFEQIVYGRYVTIIVNGNTQNNWSSITKIQLYGY